MNRLFLLSLGWCSLFLHCAGPVLNMQNASVAGKQSDVQKIAILDFEFDRPEYEVISLGNIRRPKNAGSILADVFTEVLLNTDLYQLIERRQIERILNEAGLSMSGIFESRSLKEVGQMLNVDGLVVGTVSEYCDYQSVLNWGADVDFSARLIELRSGIVLWSVSARRNLGASNSGITGHAAVTAAVQELLKKMGR